MRFLFTLDSWLPVIDLLMMAHSNSAVAVRISRIMVRGKVASI